MKDDKSWESWNDSKRTYTELEVQLIRAGDAQNERQVREHYEAERRKLMEQIADLQKQLDIYRAAAIAIEMLRK